MKKTEESPIYCAECGEEIEKDDAKVFNDKFYCELCYDNNVGICDICEKEVLIDDLEWWGDCQICPECMEERCPSFDE